jgi:hypothetical protein
VVASEFVEPVVAAMEREGFKAEHFEWSVNFKGDSKVLMQLSTEVAYRDFPARAQAADVHGILMRVASLEDTLAGKIRAWSDPQRRQSKRIKDLADIVRLTETHPHLWESLPPNLRSEVENPQNHNSQTGE